MKNNLIFSGLCEVREENTEALLRTFLHREIGIDYQIEFGNVHRFSNYPRGKRPIVARFLYFSDLQYVLKNAYKLRNSQYGIRQQFPKEIEDNRKLLYPIQKEAKRQGKKVVLVRDRLYIDNQLYIPYSEADESQMMNDTEQPLDDVWTTPTNGGSRQPPKLDSINTNNLHVSKAKPSEKIVLNNPVIENSDTNCIIENKCKLDILSLNCCGINKRLQYPEFCELLYDHDIICLQETKTDDLDTINLPGFIFHMKNRQKYGKKSGGIILAYKEKLNNYLELLETDSKYTFWFKLSSVFSKIDEDVVFGIVYIPPENSVYHQPDTFDQVENEIRSFSQNFKYICLLGDFNGRTADEPDYFEIETHEHEQDFSEFMQDNLNCLETLNIDRKRKSMDTVKNRSGQKLLELCKGNDLFIVNGRIGDDKHESETLSDNLDKDKVNSFVSKLSNLFIESAKNTFGSRKDTQKRKSTNKKPKGDKPWFNEECRFERQNYRKLKRKLKFRKTDTLKREVSEAEKRYKNTLDANSKKYRKQMRSKLKYMKTSDPKEYWNLLNRGKQKKQPNLPLEDLFDFFKKLNQTVEEPPNREMSNTDIFDNVDIDNLNDQINAYISREEIAKCIKNLKNNKACVLNKHKVKLQKNYMMFVHGVDSKTDIADHLYQSDVLSTEEKEEICNSSLTQQESNRLLYNKLIRKGGDAYTHLLEAVRHGKYQDVASEMENTELSDQEMQLCQIGNYSRF
ncbi:unnamed protein product [Mytilus edulis]|uniref:CARD domain-containing protein n=1 Tax=Mytilus edulis TaxID=6550 RepID=A0A8S3U4D2_MYTED|nr:unnamed protein product [Mytilus edulis]